MIISSLSYSARVEESQAFRLVKFTPHKYTIRAVINGQVRTIGSHVMYSATVVDENKEEANTNTGQSTR